MEGRRADVNGLLQTKYCCDEGVVAVTREEGTQRSLLSSGKKEQRMMIALERMHRKDGI